MFVFHRFVVFGDNLKKLSSTMKSSEAPCAVKRSTTRDMNRLHFEDKASIAIAAYEAFISSVDERDCYKVIESLEDSYGRGLRRLRKSSIFWELFELWCASYPPHRTVMMCCVDDDVATLHTVVKLNEVDVAAFVMMNYIDGAWLVSSERCADGSARMPLNESTTIVGVRNAS